MLLASQDKRSMNIQGRASSDSERQNLLDRLLDAVKQCQVRFGGKTELATDTDSRVTCLLAQLLAIFGHGLKKPRGTIRAFMQVGQVAGITKQEELEPDFYTVVKEHLSKNEIERFDGLHHIDNNTGRGRAWLRSTLNEHTLEKSIHNILGDQQVLRSYYEPCAFLLDQEKASMLPMIAAGLSSILFALGIDKEDLNAVTKQVSSQLPSTKEVFSNLLPSFQAPKPKEDPAAIFAETQVKTEIKKKKKKKKAAAIVSIDDIDDSQEDLCIATQEILQNYPLLDHSQLHQKQSTKSIKQGHSRSSSYPGKFKLETSHNSEANLINTQEFSREISLSDDSITKWTGTPVEELDENTSSSGFNKTLSYGISVGTIDEKDEKHIETVTDGNKTEVVHDHSVSKLTSDIMSQGSSTELMGGEKTQDQRSAPKSDIKEEGSSLPVRSFKLSFKSRKTKRNSDTDGDENVPDLEDSDINREDILSSSLAKENSDTLLVMGGADGLIPLIHKTNDDNELNISDKQEQHDLVGEEDKDSSKDSVSLSSNSWFDDADDKPDQDDLLRARSESLSAATDAAVAALELCSASNMDPMTSVSSNERTPNNDDDVKSKEETMSTTELKQAIVSMMVRKDEMEEQNRVLRQLLEERQKEKEVLEAQVEQITESSERTEEQNAAQIAALTRESEVLKHQLKKYVGAVQMLRSSMSDPATLNSQALSGIRQEEILPTLPEQQIEDIDSANEAKEYKQKLIQVAEMHGELMEFNERLQLHCHYWQSQAIRMQGELIDLRGPLPDDCQAKERTDSMAPLAAAVTSRPLINVWIPSVFLKGRGSAGVHHLYQVYIRIKDDEWNVYRRYSQFLDLHRKLYKKHKIVETFNFPSKKAFGNRGTKFVEERRKALQDYIRQVVNLLITSEPEFRSNTSKAMLLQVMPFFGDPYPPKGGKTSSIKRKNTQPYDGL